ncbi:MAG: twin-arginine translocase TatA/TatE family subunit [Candidatus Hydrogenedentota bacterium]
MFGLGATELVIILAIALVIFGGKKLKSLGGDLGGAISEFKTSLSPEEEEEAKADTEKSAPAAAATENKEATNE